MATPLGQMCPRDSGSCGVAAHAHVTGSVGSRVSSRPQIASHRLQTAIRVSVAMHPSSQAAASPMSSELLVLASGAWLALTRRTLLTASAAGAALVGTSLTVPARAARRRDPQAPAAGVVRGPRLQRRAAWGSVRRQDYLTGPARLFVRNHTKTPRSTPRPGGWNCAATASTHHARCRSPAPAAAARDRTTATIECTGNGRSFFATQQRRPPAAPRGSSAPSARSRGRASASAMCSTWPTCATTPSRCSPRDSTGILLPVKNLLSRVLVPSFSVRSGVWTGH